MLSNAYYLKIRSAFYTTLLLTMIFQVSCKKNDEYNINDINDINTDVTLFSENGLDVPLGKTEEIKVDSLMSKLDTNIRKYIEKNGDSYLVKVNGKLDLNDQISKIDMASLRDIEGVKLEESIDYNLNFNKDDFKVNGEKFEEQVKITASDIIDFQEQQISLNADFNADIEKYRPSEEQLEIKPTPLSRSLEIIPAESKQAIRDALAMIVGEKWDEAVGIPEKLIDKEISIDSEASASQVSASLDDFITKIEDIRLDENAEVDIDLRIANCFLTRGTVSTDLTVDLSKIFKIEGKDNLIVKENLSQSNSYHTTLAKKITGLVYENDGNMVSVKPQVTLKGKIGLSGLETTYNRFSETIDKNLSLEITISYKGIKVADAMLTLAEISVDEIPSVKQSVSFECTADNLKKINYISLDAPLLMDLALKKSVGDLAIRPTLTLDIPKGMGFRYGSTTLSDGGKALILDGSKVLGTSTPVTEKFDITSISPDIIGNQVSYKGDIDILASAKVSGKVKLSELLSSDSRFEIAADIKGKAVVTDYSIDTDNIAVDSPSLTKTISVKVNGAGEFGAFTVVPKGSPKVNVRFNIPDIKGIDIRAGKKAFTVELPKMLVPVASDISAYHYDPVGKTITIKENEIVPASLSIGIDRLELKPEKNQENEYEVKDSVKVYGELAIGSTTLTKKMVNDINTENLSVSVEIPSMTAGKVTLNDELSFDLSTEKEITLITADKLPKEVKYLKELTLSDVYAAIAASFKNLPEIGQNFKVDADIEMPPFITPSKVALKGYIRNNRFYTDDNKSEMKVKIEKLSDIDLAEGKDILGTVKVNGKITASSPSIEIETLKEKISCSLQISLGNDSGKIEVEKAVGNAEYEMPGHFSASFTDLPEELKGDDVILDIANPEIRIAISTNIGVPIAGNLTITPYRGGKAIAENAVSFDSIELPYSSSAGVMERKNFTFNNPELKNLVRQIPDSLVIDLNANVVKGSDCIIEPSAKYMADLDYELALPLELGKETKLGVHYDFNLKEIAQYLVGNEIGITGKMINDTPLVLNASLDVLDNDGNIIEDAVSSSNLMIDGQSTSDLEFFLNIPERYNASDIAKGSIVLQLGSIGGAIRPDNVIQITDLVAHLPKGLTIKTNQKK